VNAGEDLEILTAAVGELARELADVRAALAAGTEPTGGAAAPRQHLADGLRAAAHWAAGELIALVQSGGQPVCGYDGEEDAACAGGAACDCDGAACACAAGTSDADESEPGETAGAQVRARGRRGGRKHRSASGER